MCTMRWTEERPMQVRSNVSAHFSTAWSHFCCFFTVWLATQNHSTLVTETTVVPFLPVNPEYSSTRNQARQLHTTALHVANAPPFGRS